MKIAMISDTHTKHNEWYDNLSDDIKYDFDSADVIIHAGDFTNVGSQHDVMVFLSWFEDRPNKHKICIAGNHDFFFDFNRPLDHKQPIARTQDDIDDVLALFPGVTYLEDSAIVIDGVKFYGSPITKWFYDWAFNERPGDAINKYWDMIPEDTNVLITHGPPFGICDELDEGSVGDGDLLHAIDRVKPDVHVFGHIHEGYGMKMVNDTTFVNCSSLTGDYYIGNDPQILFYF